MKVDVAEAGRRLLSLPPSLAVAVTSVSFFALLVQAWKTKLLLREKTVAAILRVSIISQVYSVLFFGQLGGDIAKAGHLIRTAGELHRIVAAVLFDRLTGLCGLLLIGLVGFLANTQYFDPAIASSLAVIMAALLAALLALFAPIDAPIARLISWLPKRVRQHLLDTLRATRVFASDPWTLLASIAMGAVFQGIVVINCAWLGSGLGIELPLSTWAVVICVMSLVLLLPVSIGGIGLRDVTLVGLMAGCGVAGDLALALSLALLGIQLVMVAVGGILMLLPQPGPPSV